MHAYNAITSSPSKVSVTWIEQSAFAKGQSGARERERERENSALSNETRKRRVQLAQGGQEDFSGHKGKRGSKNHSHRAKREGEKEPSESTF